MPSERGLDDNSSRRYVLQSVSTVTSPCTFHVLTHFKERRHLSAETENNLDYAVVPETVSTDTGTQKNHLEEPLSLNLPIKHKLNHPTIAPAKYRTGVSTATRGRR